MLMAESLSISDPAVSLHLTVPGAPAALLQWARRRNIEITTRKPEGASGWDVKPRLLLDELDAGHAEALWLDGDMIVTRSVTQIVEEFPRGTLIVAEEWDRHPSIAVAHLWGWENLRNVAPVNSCFIRASESHRPLLERWRSMTGAPQYREAQKTPFEKRHFHLASDQALLTAALQGEFAGLPYEKIRMGQHIAQCAGSSGYRPTDRLRDLFRGLPPLIHCVGRKPWADARALGGARRFLTEFATDVSPYVLAARPVAGKLGIAPEWLRARTSAGAALRALTRNHPGMRRPAAGIVTLGSGEGLTVPLLSP